MQGELDWIVMKCLEKERARRYETANGLAMELQRYLADEPVLAGPPSAGYRLRKFVRRNKGPVLMGSLICVLLVGGIVGTTLGLFRALAAEQDTVAALKDVSSGKERAVQARIEADSARDEARKAGAKAEAVNRFLIQGMLASADPARALGRKITVEEALDAAAAKIGTAFHEEPEVEGEIRNVFGPAIRRPSSALIEVGTDHRLADPEPLEALLRACLTDMLLNNCHRR